MSVMACGQSRHGISLDTILLSTWCVCFDLMSVGSCCQFGHGFQSRQCQSGNGNMTWCHLGHSISQDMCVSTLCQWEHNVSLNIM